MKTKVTKEITFDAAHRLLNYDGPCSNLHGHTYRLQCTWEGDVLESGFVIDFNSAKKIMEMWVSERFDHAVILHHEDPLADILRQNGQRVFLMWGNPTAENMARLIKDSINCQEVTLWETPTSFATV